MRKFYFDSSAYVKLFSPEPGSPTADLLFRLAYDKRIQILMSYWTINETTAALDRKHRRKEISDENYPIIRATVAKNLISYGSRGSTVGLVPLPNDLLRNSIEVINEYHVSADDALHLYTALITNCEYFICHDQKLVTKTKGQMLTMAVVDITNSYSMTKLTKLIESSDIADD